MREEKLFRAIGAVNDDLVEEADGRHGSRRPALKLALRWGAAAACLALIVGLGLTRFPSTPQLIPQIQEPMAARGEMVPFSSPAGMRKIFNYNGYRYAFLENGAAYDLSGIELTDSLGILEHDILAGMDGFGDNEAAGLDFATTFALGGELYAVPGYDPGFRLAVVWEGSTYLADLVAQVDDRPLDAGYFLGVSDLEARIQRVEIQPHMGGEALSTIKGAKAKALVRLLADSQPAQLAEEDYLSMASAQSAGQSWQLALCLNDGTSLNLYLIPHLGLVSIGDSTYSLPEDFLEQFGGRFDGLTQGAVPLY